MDAKPSNRARRETRERTTVASTLQESLSSPKLPEVKIDCFKLQIRKERSTKKKGYVILSDFFKDTNNFRQSSTEGKGFVNFFSKYIASFEGKFAVNAEGKGLHLHSDSVSFGSTSKVISGIIEGGSINAGGFIKDQDNPSNDVFVLTNKHIEGYPFFFMLYFPDKSNIALLLVQSFSTKTSTEVFKSHLKRFFIEYSNDYVLDISSLIPSDVVKEFQQKGTINKFVIRKQNLSSDKAEKIFGMEYKEGTRVTIELKVSGIKSLSNAREFITNMMSGSGTNLFALEEVREIGFDGNYETLFEYEHNGKKSSIRSGNNFQLSPSFYVSESDIERGENFAPTVESISEYCKSLLNSLCDQLSLPKPNEPEN